MKRIAPIRLEYDPKTLWFDPGELEVAKGDSVVVETARGTEFGVAASGVVEVEDERIDSLKTPLKPILRVATEEDFAQRDEMRRLSAEALPVFRELAAETNEQMRPIMVEYLFDGTKASLFLARGIYTRHKMISYDINLSNKKEMKTNKMIAKNRVNKKS